MQLLRELLSNRRVQIALAAAIGMAVAAAWVAWKTGVDVAILKGLWGQVNDYLVRHPSALFWALVVLPGLPVPTSALLFTAGVVWRDRPVMACLLCLLALTLNLTWTYWLAAAPARRLVEKMLAATSVQIPVLSKGNDLKFILVMRLTPGIPFFFQNYLLGFLKVPFHLYLLISVLAQALIGTGVILTGKGVADGMGQGSLVPAITGICLIALGIVLTHTVRGWLAQKKVAAFKHQTATPLDDHAGGDGFVGAGIDKNE